MNTDIHTAFNKHNIIYFNTFNNLNNSFSLLRYIIRYPNHKYTIAVAFTTVHPETQNNVWKFAIFRDWIHFFNVLQDIATSYHQFYNIFTSPRRSLYMDLDFTSNNVKLLSASKSIGKRIKKNIISAINNLQQNTSFRGTNIIPLSIHSIAQNILLFDSSRFISPIEIKLSYHVLLPIIYYESLSMLQCDIAFIQPYLTNHLHHVFHGCNICDDSVYKGDYYQLFRMPGSIKPDDPSSTKRLINDEYMQYSLLSQIIFNQCGAASLPFIHSSTKINFPSFVFEKKPNKYIQHIRHRISNNKQRCDCNASYVSNTTFTFASIVNKLEWNEVRCNWCKRILAYSANNSSISKHNPRIYANLYGLVTEIEHLYHNLVTLQISSINNYLYLFKEHESISTQPLLQFSNAVVSPCRHQPNFVKKYCLTSDTSRFGDFAVFCHCCKQTHGRGWYNVKTFK